MPVFSPPFLQWKPIPSQSHLPASSTPKDWTSLDKMCWEFSCSNIALQPFSEMANLKYDLRIKSSTYTKCIMGHASKQKQKKNNDKYISLIHKFKSLFLSLTWQELMLHCWQSTDFQLEEVLWCDPKFHLNKVLQESTLDHQNFQPKKRIKLFHIFIMNSSLNVNLSINIILCLCFILQLSKITWI